MDLDRNELANPITPPEEEEEEESDWCGGDHQQEPFPGLNKAHGFFSLIERNQRDRDTYHQKMEERKQTRKKKMEKEWKGEQEARRRPPLTLYKPPHQRGARGDSQEERQQPRSLRVEENPQQRGVEGNPQQEAVYRLEVELRPKCWRNITVQCGEEEVLVAELTRKYHLTSAISEALLYQMVQFRHAHFS